MLKMRDVVRSFHRKELGNGKKSSFWFDNWSERGIIFTLLGGRRMVDMGVSREATVEEAVKSVGRRRRHRSQLLKDIEADLVIVGEKLRDGMEDINKWRRRSGFKQNFSTFETWTLLRPTSECCSWYKGVWFPQATPKYAFVTWLAVRNRLSTIDTTAKWRQGVDETCVLCKYAPETRTHYFSSALTLLRFGSISLRVFFAETTLRPGLRLSL